MENMQILKDTEEKLKSVYPFCKCG